MIWTRHLKGIMFSNLPNLVPLTATYDGPAIERSVIRTFTVVDDGSYFTQGTPTAEWDWEKKGEPYHPACQ